MLNGLLSDRPKLQTENARKCFNQNARGSIIIQRRHTKIVSGLRFGVASVGSLHLLGGAFGGGSVIVILFLKIGLEAGSPEEKPGQAPGERDSGIKPADFPVRGRRCSPIQLRQKQPRPLLSPSLQPRYCFLKQKQILFAALFNRLLPYSGNNAFTAGPDGPSTAADFYSPTTFVQVGLQSDIGSTWLSRVSRCSC